ncbi:uroporphyrinogen-III synthase [Qipengyuania nanhaisediminis]|uniref:uroporphyrinogen-III synthase n=1 Tax=Qipengyuania nanhaisediminis TaxID=604088 RepID=UPI0038B34730
MTAKVIVTRPRPGLDDTLARARAVGLDAVGHPLSEIEPRGWHGPDPEQVDALLVGSANAIRHGGEELRRYGGKPVHAVGKATAEAARRAGFAVASVGSGGLQSVADTIRPPSRLLRVAGAEHVPLGVAEGVSVTTVIAYEAVPLALPEALRDMQQHDLVVMLHSAGAAAQLAKEARRLELDPSRIALAAIGPRVAAAAGDGWRAIHVCDTPSDAALLDMVRRACL